MGTTYETKHLVHECDKRAQKYLRTPAGTVKKIWKSFCDHISQSLLDCKPVSVSGLGLFTFHEERMQGQSGVANGRRKRRSPVFVLSDAFLRSNGLFYDQPLYSKMLRTAELNYYFLAVDNDISKEAAHSCIRFCLQRVGELARLQKVKKLRIHFPGLGHFCVRDRNVSWQWERTLLNHFGVEPTSRRASLPNVNPSRQDIMDHLESLPAGQRPRTSSSVSSVLSYSGSVVWGGSASSYDGYSRAGSVRSSVSNGSVKSTKSSVQSLEEQLFPNRRSASPAMNVVKNPFEKAEKKPLSARQMLKKGDSDEALPKLATPRKEVSQSAATSPTDGTGSSSSLNSNAYAAQQNRRFYVDEGAGASMAVANSEMMRQQEMNQRHAVEEKLLDRLSQQRQLEVALRQQELENMVRRIELQKQADQNRNAAQAKTDAYRSEEKQYRAEEVQNQKLWKYTDEDKVAAEKAEGLDKYRRALNAQYEHEQEEKRATRSAEAGVSRSAQKPHLTRDEQMRIFAELEKDIREKYRRAPDEKLTSRVPFYSGEDEDADVDPVAAFARPKTTGALVAPRAPPRIAQEAALEAAMSRYHQQVANERTARMKLLEAHERAILDAKSAESRALETKRAAQKAMYNSLKTQIEHKRDREIREKEISGKNILGEKCALIPEDKPVNTKYEERRRRKLKSALERQMKYKTDSLERDRKLEHERDVMTLQHTAEQMNSELYAQRMKVMEQKRDLKAAWETQMRMRDELKEATSFT